MNLKTKQLVLVCLGLIVLIMICSCYRKSQKREGIESINIHSAFENKEPISVSDIAQSIEYIKLQSENCPVLNSPNIIDSYDSLIIVTGFRQLLVFLKKDGEFLYEISSYGRGPEEYMFVVEGYDEKEGLVFAAQDLRNYAGFSINGGMKTTYTLPEHSFSDSLMFSVISNWRINNSTYLGYTKNHTGNFSTKIVVFNSKGEIVNRFPNYNSFQSNIDGIVSLDRWQGWFYQLQDTIRFYEDYTDTIFTVSENDISPRYFLNMKELSPPYHIQAIPESYKNERLEYFQLLKIRESSRFVFFYLVFERFSYMGYYDKKTKETRICDNLADRSFYKFPEYWAVRNIGFVNDMDSFIPIGTGSTFYINRQNELITYASAYEVKRWFDMNPEKAIRLPDHLRKLKPEGEENNPIIIILKLKE